MPLTDRLRAFPPLYRLVESVGRILRPEGRRGIRRMGHRRYVGGRWEEIGRLQLDFLVAEGLEPHHHLLDVACGSLRAGVHLVPYLEPGHYLGIEKEEALVRAGIDEELGRELYEEKRPRLMISDRFEFDRFDVLADFAIAQSLFTHLPPDPIRLCLARLRPALTPGGRFYATFCESERPVANPRRPHDHGLFRYTRGEMRRFGDETGWTMEYLGDWSHPAGQKMVLYLPQPGRSTPTG